MIDRTLLIFAKVFERTYLIVYRLNLAKHNNVLSEWHGLSSKDITDFLDEEIKSETRIILQYAN
jgi:hypothetical protein